MTIVYLDVLIALNIYVTYFLIKATSLFTHTRIKGIRIAAASFAGGISSLLILVPELNFILSIIIKLAFGFLIVLISYGFRDVWTYLRNSLFFIIINYVFAGFMLMLWNLCAPLGMVYNNGFVYFDVSFLTLLISTILAYGVVRVVRYLLDSKLSLEDKYKVRVKFRQNTVNINAFADTGNSMTDFFTGYPVIICSEHKMRELFMSTDINIDSVIENPTEHIKGIRYLPYSTVGFNGLMPVFRPDEIFIISENTEKTKRIDAMIGISAEMITDENIDAIFNPKILI